VTIQKSEAILLAKRDIRETSAIVAFCTRDFGKIKGLIKGVRGPQAKFGLYLREFAKFDIVYYEKQRTDTYMVTQCDLKYAYTEIAEDFDKVIKAYYILELVDKFTPLGEKSPETYDLLAWILDFIAREKFVDSGIILFELKLLEYSGLLPSLDFCTGCSKRPGREGYFSVRNGGLLCGDCSDSDIQAIRLSKGAASSINMIRKHKVENLGRLTITNTVSKELRMLIDKFIEYHLGEHLKTRTFIKQVGTFHSVASP